MIEVFLLLRLLLIVVYMNDQNLMHVLLRVLILRILKLKLNPYVAIILQHEVGHILLNYRLDTDNHEVHKEHQYLFNLYHQQFF